MSVWDVLATYGPGIGGVAAVAGVALLFWAADRRREGLARERVRAEAEPLMELREALVATRGDEMARRVVLDWVAMRGASDAKWEREHQALLLRDPHPPG